MKEPLECPKCRGDLRRGRLYTVAAEKRAIDRLFGYVNWEATDAKKFDGIFAYKCEKCGFIEFYAKRRD